MQENTKCRLLVNKKTPKLDINQFLRVSFHGKFALGKFGRIFLILGGYALSLTLILG